MTSPKPVVLVTGASGGIGGETARVFLENSWEVIAVDREPSWGDGMMFLQTDLAEPAAVKQLGISIRTKYNRLDAVVNNAAEQLTKPLIETSVGEWDHVMASNVRSIYLLTTELVSLLAHECAIVNVASVHAIATSPGLAAYVASKGAVLALTRAMALELAPRRIRVNAVLPGAIDTPMLRAGLGQRSGSPIDALSNRHPLGRVGQPRDVAEAIYFLSDPRRSAFITGQTLVVDGGAIARLSTE